ncbi:MAG TPA: Lrp/AsnC family transcriptional regulator [Clostridia bacterium]|nr:Lrp/AsnC family transcriptional regulator [Clostridia bacterium]HPQ45838.1 Lrp/AsnC family transcriptional regulator [Clostridia bacterium]HRX41981.1 Lrp/AsnC family transcriptional regulator [Clostridia bacterium]
MREILEILEKNSKATTGEITAMTGYSEAEVADAIAEFEKNGTIRGYKAVINWDKTDRDFVTALIEVKLTPQRDKGFDRMAARIYKYPQVRACYLMSGSYDLTVIVEGAGLKEVAMFVSEKLSVIDGVLSTATHFVLKKYKDGNILLEGKEDDDREAIVL